MTKTTQAFFKKALKLPRDARADLIELLLNSILEDESSAQQKIDKAWAKEARDRFDAYLRGEMKGYPLDEVMERLKKRQAS